MVRWWFPAQPYQAFRFVGLTLLCRLPYAEFHTKHTSIGQLYRTRYAAANATHGRGKLTCTLSLREPRLRVARHYDGAHGRALVDRI
jgi:hypothetical protein